MTQEITPNSPATATDTNAVAGLDAIAAKMDAMKAMTQRNQLRATDGTEAGVSDEAITEEPVAPNGESQPEVADTDYPEYEDSTEEAEIPEQVNPAEADTGSEELIDFIEFAETNPNAKFRFLRNGKEVVIDAKKAASILGQGGAIHEEARQLKIQKSEFDEYLKGHRAQQEGLTLAMEFTVEPRLQQAYDEIIKTQNYQSTFQQQLASTQDPGQQARIRASMEQNERYMQQQGAVIGQLKPAVDQFRQIRQQQVTEILENNRRGFTDKELRNEYVFNELRDRIGKMWAGANNELVPGVKNIDLISSDETLMGLVRDGLKFRGKPSTRTAGASLATLTGRKGGVPNSRGEQARVDQLREQAKGGDKKAADNLLVLQLSKLKASRGGR
jgi:hypothetical protein